MKRRAHILSTNKGTERPRHIIYLDSESRVEYYDADGRLLVAALDTDGKEIIPDTAVRTIHHPYLAVARYIHDYTDRKPTREQRVYGTNNRPLTEIVDDLTAFCPVGSRTVMIAHNIEYDLLALGLIPQMVTAGWTVRDYFTKGLTTIVRFRRGKQTLVCQSSTHGVGSGSPPMKRRAHILSANKGTERPRHIIYLDSESRVEYYDADGRLLVAALDNDGKEIIPDTAVRTIHHPYLAVARYIHDYTDRKPTREQRIYGTNNRPLTEIVDDLTAFCPTGSRTVMIAHNVEYDLLALGLIPQMVTAGWTVRDYFTKGLTTIVRFRRGKQTLVCQSSTNIYQTSLAELGVLFGVPKLAVDYNRDDLAVMTEYCIRDVEILETAMRAFTAFVETENLGVQALTVAGQSFNAYRHRFMSYPIYIHTTPETLALERRAYIGGRVECFRLGEMPRENWYAVDVNSMYPAVMRAYDYPVKLVDTLYGVDAQTVAGIIGMGQAVIADVTVETATPRYAVVHDGRLLFPVGTFETTLTTPDLMMAIEHNELRDIRYVAVYDTAPIFTEFVDYFYAMKTAATDPILRYFYKLILNSCYGKFGQRAETMVSVGECDASDVYTVADCWSVAKQQAFVTRAFGGTVFECYRDREESVNSFPAIAAHVTAYARRELWRGVETAGIENVVYCDTDSLFTNEHGFHRMRDAGLIDARELGKWDNEKTTDTLTIRGPKDYTFGETTRLKGVRKGSKQRTADTWTTVVWPRLLGAIGARRLDHYENVVRDKTMKREYRKGTVSDAGSVLPFTLVSGIVDVRKGESPMRE